jgi:hypothetical protein
MRRLCLLLGLFALLAACGSSGDTPRDGDIDPDLDAAPWPDGGPGELSAANFRYGINIGYENPAFSDPMSATLAQRAGARSIRVKLPAEHLETWGDDIEVADNMAYAQLGMGNHIGFLIGAPDRARSTMPADAPDWQIEYYPPKGLYEPIFLANGDVNPANPFADYIFRVVSTYKPWIRVWHIWNEPDFVSDYDVTLTWDTQPPTKAQLVRFNGSIFDYVRMLRIAHEVAHKADPDALIATGGIGYASFLDAILRYSDDPAGGGLSADYPSTGADYIDVVDFHYYPLYGPKSSDAAVDDYLAAKAALQAKLDAYGKTISGWNTSEIGAPHAKIGNYPGGNAFAIDFLIKSMVMAQAAGIGGLDWFILSDSGDGSNPFGRMGLYDDVAGLTSIDQAHRNELGTAYATMTTLLSGKSVDAAATTALALPAGARGEAFRGQDGAQVLVLWAKVPADSETATVTVTIAGAPADGFEVYQPSGDQLGTPTVDGSATLELTGTPVFLVGHQ